MTTGNNSKQNYPLNLQEELAEAVALLYHLRAQEDPEDQEHLRLVLQELRHLLSGTEIDFLSPKALLDPLRLRVLLRETYPARVAAQEYPNRLLHWWKSRPPKQSQQFREWLVRANFLFSQAAVSLEN